MKGTRGDTGLTGSQGLKGSKGLPGSPGVPAPIVGGVTYNRWGSTSCRSGSALVYAGKTGSDDGFRRGGGSNYICLHNSPEYHQYRSGVQGHSYVYTTEYELTIIQRHEDNTPCAVCYVPDKHAIIMIPARRTCPSGWTEEYCGFLMSERIAHYRSMYVYVDESMEEIANTSGHDTGGHLYHVEAVLWSCDYISSIPFRERTNL